jgi:hypothetical protein
MKSSAKNVLVIDVGGTSVKILATGQSERRSFLSGPTLTPGRMVSEVKKLVKKLDELPPNCRAGDNANAFRGGFRLWG